MRLRRSPPQKASSARSRWAPSSPSRRGSSPSSPRTLGSVAEAEDVVQDAFLRYQRALDEQPAEIELPKAYLSAVATRLAIDRLRSARVRKEHYVGEWLPEPLLTDETTLDGARYVE